MKHRRLLALIAVFVLVCAAGAGAAVVGVSVTGDNLTCDGSPCGSSVSVPDNSAVTIRATADATTTTTTSTTTTTPPPGRWIPPKALTWYWQLTGTVKTEPVMATDMDGFDNGASTVAKFHAAGQKAICYIDVGSGESGRPDYSTIPKADLGKSNGWPGEKWLNVADLSGLSPVMHKRFQMCQSEGYDAVEPDNMDGYSNTTGFTISASQQLAFNEWVANDVHSLGMAVFQKNDGDQAKTLQPYFDGAIDEECNKYKECGAFSVYIAVNKPVLNAEYTEDNETTSKFCSADKTLGFMGALFNLDLNGKTFQPCWS